MKKKSRMRKQRKKQIKREIENKSKTEKNTNIGIKKGENLKLKGRLVKVFKKKKQIINKGKRKKLETKR